MTRFTFIICSIQSNNICKVQMNCRIQAGRGAKLEVTVSLGKCNLCEPVIAEDSGVFFPWKSLCTTDQQFS